MNLYLTHLASNLPQIRQQLDITQEDLSILMGISRPTLVKIEKENERFTQAMAACLYVALTAQLEKDKQLINELKNEHYSTWKSLLNKSVKLTTLSPSTMRNSFIKIPNLPNVLKEKANAFFSGKNKKSQQNSTEQDDLIAEDYLSESLDEYAVEYLQHLQKEISEKEKFCLQIFQLDEWSSLKLIENIQKYNL